MADSDAPSAREGSLGINEFARAMRFLMTLHAAPGGRLPAHEVRRLAVELGLGERELSALYAEVPRVIVAQVIWCVLTPEGKQLFEANFARWMSRAE